MSMQGEVLETREGFSLNRGTDRDIQASRETAEWLRSKEGRTAGVEIGHYVFRMFHNAVQHGGKECESGEEWSPL